jgi:hypothetical protein
MRTRHLVPNALFAAALLAPAAATAQQRDTVRSPSGAATATWANRFNFSGPRFGATYLNSTMVEKLASNGIEVGNVVTQFGWQFEREIYTVENGPMALNEWVLLVGGLDRGVFLPSLSWLVGVRGRNGIEMGIGPNVTPLGISLAGAAGVNIRRAGMNFPVNLALVSSKSGVRVSVLTGFTLH